MSANIASAAIIVAAGKGQRAGGDVPKQYRKLGGMTVLERTFRAISHGAFDYTVIVVAPGDERWKTLDLPGAIFTTGGASRTESVRNGLDALAVHAPDRVFIHDAARPFVVTDIIARLHAALDSAAGAVPVLPVVDAVKTVEGDQVCADVPRDTLRRVQTPQAFRFTDIREAFQAVQGDFPDDVAVAVEAGLAVTAVEGDAGNVKLTYPEDFAAAEADMTHTRLAVGTGYDVHQTCEGDHVWLCGVKVPAPFGLLGHSDADVGLHALVDAILGALAEGDIGDHFPPTDPKWKGAESWRFLDFCRERVAVRGGSISHVDVTLICEAPKVKPHRDAMRARVAEILSIPVAHVGLKATTTEKLGFTGRGEGLAAQAVASLVLPA